MFPGSTRSPPWNIPGTSNERPRNLRERPRNVPGTSWKRPRNVPGMSQESLMEHPRNVPGTSNERPMNIPGTSQERSFWPPGDVPWCSQGSSMERSRHVPLKWQNAKLTIRWLQVTSLPPDNHSTYWKDTFGRKYDCIGKFGNNMTPPPHIPRLLYIGYRLRRENRSGFCPFISDTCCCVDL